MNPDPKTAVSMENTPRFVNGILGIFISASVFPLLRTGIRRLASGVCQGNRLTPGRETVCSAPVCYRGVAQSGSAFGSGPKSREFKSHRPDFENSGRLPPEGDHFFPIKPIFFLAFVGTTRRPGVVPTLQEVGNEAVVIPVIFGHSDRFLAVLWMRTIGRTI